MAKNERHGNIGTKSKGLRGKSTAVADWASCDGEILKRAIIAASSVGGALRFGCSRDSGAYCIGIYGDGEPYTEWVKGSEDIDTTLTLVIELFEGIADDPKTHSRGK